MASNERLRLRIDDDGLAAWLEIAEGPPLPREALIDRLAALGIATGLDSAALDRAGEALASEAALAHPLCIARGRPARPAIPERLELTAEIGPLPGRVRDDGRFDYRERGLIVPVCEGEVVGRIVPGEPGENGFDVRGAVLEVEPPKPIALEHGPGIQTTEAGELVATRAGARTVDRKGTLDVVPLVVHAGPVDLESGNLATEGSLEIKRDVSSGMSVRAGADLVVRGTVDVARVEAGGSLEISGGVIGGESGSVRAGGNLTLRHAQSARLTAGGLLKVKRSVVASRLVAREVEIGEAVRGERVQAETRIVVRDAGSSTGEPCQLRAAHPLEAPAGDPSESEANRARARERMRESAAPLAARKSRDSRKGRGERPNAPTAGAIGQKQSFRRRERELQSSARIEVTGIAHPGCRIDFGGRVLVLEEEKRRCVFRFDVERGEVVVEGK